jgi:aryl-alcohol dehydrogenase-like predicted oxidoreductase
MIGYSVYSPDEADLLEKVYKPDMIQIPFNLIDRRILNNDWLLEQKHKNIKIHARSIFLQGLLLLPLDQIPNKFQIWLKIWNTWHQWLQVNSSLPMATCLNFVASNPMIDGLVIGVDNLAHLKEIVGAYDESMPTYIPSISSEDVRLINPSNWNYL